MNPNNILAIIPDCIFSEGQYFEIEDDILAKYKIPSSIAIIYVIGLLYQNDYKDLIKEILSAEQNQFVEGIIMSFNSPGGTTLGISNVVDCVRNSKKPIIAIANHVCCSAAYWIGSQCTKLYLGSETSVVGSIGVIATHIDCKEADERYGIIATEIVTGTYKNLTSPLRSFDEKSLAYYQARVNEVFDLFVDDVVSGRGLSSEKIRSFEGIDFLGKKAVDEKLADGLLNFNFLEVSDMGIKSLFAKTQEEKARASEKEKKDPEKEVEAEDPEKEVEDKNKKKAKKEDPEVEDKKEEQARILGLLSLAGVNLSQNVLFAIKNAVSMESFAVQELGFIRKKGNKDLSSLISASPPAVSFAGDTDNKNELNAVILKATSKINAERKK